MLPIIRAHIGHSQMRLRGDILEIIDDLPNSDISWPWVGRVIASSEKNGEEIRSRGVRTEDTI